MNEWSHLVLLRKKPDLAGTGVYIFNREKVAGVMLTQEQYETLLQELDVLRQTVKEELEEHRKWKTMPSLTRNVVVSLIQSVKVYEGGDIEIVLDCDDEYRKIVARAGELERQHDAERLVV